MKKCDVCGKKIVNKRGNAKYCLECAIKTKRLLANNRHHTNEKIWHKLDDKVQLGLMYNKTQQILRELRNEKMEEKQIVKVTQNTEEWLKARRGKITASQVYNLMKSGRKKDEVLGVTAMKYILERFASGLVDSEPEATSAAMQWGKDHEAEARDMYERAVVDSYPHMKVEEVGFVTISGFEDIAGTSPDGLVVDYNKDDERLVLGCIEIKCPYTSAVHVESLLENDIPHVWYDKYYAQCQMNMLATGTDWCDFISYDPRMTDANKRIMIKRIDRDMSFVSDLLTRLSLAHKIIDEYKKQLGVEEGWDVWKIVMLTSASSFATRFVKIV